MLRYAAILVTVTSALFATANPAAADFRLERRLALNPGGTFTLDSDAGSVTLIGDSSSGAVITVTSPDDHLTDRLDIQFATVSGSATVTAKRRVGSFGRLFDGFRGNVHFEVHVPRATLVEVHTGGGSVDARGVAGPARIHTSGGSIAVTDVEKDLDASTSGGSIHVEHVKGRAEVHTSGGSINVTGVSGDLRATTSGGSVDVRDAGGRVEAHSSGGSVSAAFVRGNNRGGDLSTSGGGVHAEIDPRAALSIDASTSGGRVVTDVPVTVHGSLSGRSLHGDLNGGGAMLQMHSSGGGIRISAIPASSASR